MRLGCAALVAAFTISISTALIAQDPPPIWAGVYTTTQAERGATVIQRHCSECHHDDLSGGEGPALAGSTFMVKWEMQSVERLFHKIRDTMPEVGSTDVTDSEKLDSVAYILQQNGFPAGRCRADRQAGRARGTSNGPSRRVESATPRRPGSGCWLSAGKHRQEMDSYREYGSSRDDAGSADAGG